jgi:hypothetical protein
LRPGSGPTGFNFPKVVIRILCFKIHLHRPITVSKSLCLWFVEGIEIKPRQGRLVKRVVVVGQEGYLIACQN